MVFSEATNINFPNLGIELEKVHSSINVFGLDIKFYGIIIACGMAMGYLVAEWQAKRTKQNPELYLDFALYAIVLSVIGARLYYVVFAWDDYKDNPIDILNIRTGGLAIYGGVIAAILTAIIYSKIKKISFALLADTACLGLITGQAIGRWGNFFNREAFGQYTNNLFAMQVDIREVSGDYSNPISYLQEKYADNPHTLDKIMEIRNHEVLVQGATYIQVHPTFLYESVWNCCVLLILILYSKHKKFNGEIFLLYLIGYGLGRVWIEGLRTDQLILWNTTIPVSQLLSALLVVIAVVVLIYKRVMIKAAKKL